MTAHANVETLSAYLDRELSAAEAERLEVHLRDCRSCRAHLDSLRRVVIGLHAVERVEAPPLLASEVRRRVALEPRRKGLAAWVDRLEKRLAGLPLDSTTFTLAAVIVALAAMSFLFIEGVDRAERQRTPLVVTSTVPWTVPGAFEPRGDAWWPSEAPEGAEVSAVYAADAPEARAIFESRPELEKLLSDDMALVVQDETGRWVRIEERGTGFPDQVH